jgi:serine/threonine protein kinase
VTDVEFRERFNREADLAADLYHPHIVGVNDRGEDMGRLWISMDFTGVETFDIQTSECRAQGRPQGTLREPFVADGSATHHRA